MAQLDYQLNAISSTLEESLNVFLSPCNLSSEIAIQTKDDYVCITNRQDEANRRFSLKLTPLFPGSFSQNDVIVQDMSECGIPISRSTLSAINSCAVEPVRKSWYKPSTIEPTLHYARFNALPQSVAAIYQSKDKPITIFVEREGIEGEEHKLRALRQIRRIIELHPSCDNIVIVHLNSDKNFHLQSSISKDKNCQIFDSFDIPDYISWHNVSTTNEEQLFTLFSRSQAALIPSLSLAMDATSAGCPIHLYSNKALNYQLLRRLISIDETNRLQQSLLQHLAIRAYQLDRYNDCRLVRYKDELHEILLKLTFEPINTLQPEKILQYRHSQQSVIIPQNTQYTNTIKQRLKNTKSKYRKLRHSPKQFLQDSANPGLRKLGKLAGL